ncbi:hypothetical protein FS837_003346 [Tulasnella sp. UAMH 9824]|nr:hypothetical protein FS837_003346 [Tulasnella sp. UAMH 9824]
MQSKKRCFADVDPEGPEPTSNHDDASSRTQLSANMTRRLEELASWRIDPSLLKFSKLGANFEGGCAVVSQALLYSSSDAANDQVLESNNGGLMTSNRASQSEDANERREQEASGDEGRNTTEGATGGQEHEDNPETSEGRKLAIREAEFLVNHSQENIIELEGFVEDVSKNIIWLVFPWEENGNLNQFIASAEWEIPERISLLHDVASGMEYLHTRNPPICHGDLKSANILVNSDCRAVITDFGSAHHPTTKNLERKTKRARIDPQPAPSPEATFCPSTNTITLTHNKWTLRWAAPELLENDDASLASDVWAFGCVVYEVMTDSIPFQDVRDANVIMRVVKGDLPSISSDARMLLVQALCTLVRKCWRIDPSKRPTAEECRAAINWMPMIVPNPVRPAGAADSSGRSAGLLMQLGDMHKRQNDYSNASKYFVEALSLYTHITDRNGEVRTLRALADIHIFQGNYSQAVTVHSKCLQISTDIGDRHGQASALWGLAQVHRLRNEYDQAVTFYSECLQIRTDIGDRHGRAEALWGLAEVHRLRNEYDQAVTLYSECLQIRTDIGDRHGRASALWGLAEVHRLRNEYDQAVTLYSECLQIRTDIGDRHGRADALFGLAELHRARNEYDQALKLFSEALQISIGIGSTYLKAHILFGVANTHHDQAHYRGAVDHYEQAAEAFQQLGDTRNAAAAGKRASDARQLLVPRGAVQCFARIWG